MGISELIGKTITKITGNSENSESIIFTCSDGTFYEMYHYSDCCESVMVDKIDGDLAHLIGSPILLAEKTNPETGILGKVPVNEESFTWTDFTIETSLGKVVFEWLGCSNGYYGEEPDFKKKEFNIVDPA